MQVEAKIEELGLTLPTPGTPLGNYVPGVRTGNLVFLSGVGPGQAGGQQWSGKVGRDYTTEEGLPGSSRMRFEPAGQPQERHR